MVHIETVLFYQVTDPKAADYQISDYRVAIGQLCATMLRSVIGTMDLEGTLSSRDRINAMLRGVLDEASGKWCIRVTWVEIKTCLPTSTCRRCKVAQGQGSTVWMIPNEVTTALRNLSNAFRDSHAEAGGSQEPDGPGLYDVRSAGAGGSARGEPRDDGEPGTAGPPQGGLTRRI